MTTSEVIACATCEDTDGPFKEIDGIHLCEGCVGIADSTDGSL
jgi:hypothetical protein